MTDKNALELVQEVREWIEGNAGFSGQDTKLAEAERLIANGAKEAYERGYCDGDSDHDPDGIGRWNKLRAAVEEVTADIEKCPAYMDAQRHAWGVALRKALEG